MPPEHLHVFLLLFHLTKYIFQTFYSITVTYYNVNHICNIFVIFVDPNFTKWHLPVHSSYFIFAKKALVNAMSFIICS